MSFSGAQAAANARADVGYREGWNNENKYTPWQTWGRLNFAPYCASAVCRWAWDAGFVFDQSCVWGVHGDWNVGAQHQWAVRKGIWRPNWVQARPGWLAIESFGIPDQHVEMVWSDPGQSMVTTIGANTGGGVYFRSRPRGVIVGFAALDEAGQTGPAPPDVEEPAPKKEDDVHTISLRTGKFPYPYIALDPTNRKVLGWNGAGVHWEGGKPSSGQHVGSRDPYSWTIPGTEPILGWDKADHEGQNDGERQHFVLNTYGTSGSQYKGYLFRR